MAYIDPQRDPGPQKALFQRADHSNRGREWENQLKAVHDWYRLAGKADVIQNPNEWSFISPTTKRSTAHRYDKGTFATTDDGRLLMRQQSDVDFSGGGKGFAVCFDAKTCAVDRFPIDSFREHQILRLRQSSRCGTIAGFLIRMSSVDRVFWIPADYAENRYFKWKTAPRSRGTTKTRGRVAAGVGSLSIEDLEGHGIEVTRNKVNGLWDWLAVVLA
jgi:recombination protein U